MNTDKLVSIIGTSYFQPIADLFEKLLSHPRTKSNTVQATRFENGYSASIILLLVALLESCTCRLRYIKKTRGMQKSERSALNVITTYYPRLKHRKAIIDVYVLRDVIFHNHVWEIDYEWGDVSGMALQQAVKDSLSGDKKYVDRVNPKTRKTKALKLNVVPIRVDRTDVLKVFQTVWKTLMVFEKEDRMICYVSHLHVRYKGESILFSKLADLHASTF